MINFCKNSYTPLETGLLLFNGGLKDETVIYPDRINTCIPHVILRKNNTNLLLNHNDKIASNQIIIGAVSLGFNKTGYCSFDGFLRIEDGTVEKSISGYPYKFLNYNANKSLSTNILDRSGKNGVYYKKWFKSDSTLREDIVTTVDFSTVSNWPDVTAADNFDPKIMAIAINLKNIAAYVAGNYNTCTYFKIYFKIMAYHYSVCADPYSISVYYKSIYNSTGTDVIDEHKNFPEKWSEGFDWHSGDKRFFTNTLDYSIYLREYVSPKYGIGIKDRSKQILYLAPLFDQYSSNSSISEDAKTSRRMLPYSLCIYLTIIAS